jgi:hypothetical protein
MTAPVRFEADRRLAVLARLELRHAWLRLKKAEIEIEWAGALLAAGQLNPVGALGVLDDAMAELTGEGGS